MKEKILSIARTKTFYQSSYVSFATLINGLLGFAFYTLMARFLDTSSFGIFSVAIVFVGLIADIANIGTDTGIINFVGRYIRDEKDKALQFLKLGLVTKMIVATIVVLVGWFTVPYVANSVLTKPELLIPLRLALIGAAATMLFSFAMSSLQAIQRFFVWGAVNIFANAGRLVLAYILFLAGTLTVVSGLDAFTITLLVGFLFSFLFLPKFLGAKNISSIYSEFFKYNRWIATFTLIGAFSSRLDTFLVTKYMSLSDVGIYSVALNLTSIVAQIVGAIATVVAPKLAGFETNAQAIKYLKKVQLFVSVLAILGILVGLPIGYFVINKFYGDSYLGSFTPYVILIISQAIFLISIPVHTAVIYYFSYPKLFFYISIIHLFIIGIGGHFLINTIGITGAAIIVLIGNVSNLLIPLYWTIKKFKK